jgi:hypothetical protein
LKKEQQPVAGFLAITRSHSIAVVQKRFQRQMLLQYGRKGMTIDATDGITGYRKIRLVTLMALGDSERAIPVAHCLTNYKDTDSINIFFRSLETQLLLLNLK